MQPSRLSHYGLADLPFALRIWRMASETRWHPVVAVAFMVSVTLALWAILIGLALLIF